MPDDSKGSVGDRFSTQEQKTALRDFNKLIKEVMERDGVSFEIAVQNPNLRDPFGKIYSVLYPNRRRITYKINVPPEVQITLKNMLKETDRAPHGTKEVATKRILLDACRIECKNRDLPKGETITAKVKYEIAKAIGLKLPAFKSFKSGNASYHFVSKMLSELGYSRKHASKFRD